MKIDVEGEDFGIEPDVFVSKHDHGFSVAFYITGYNEQTGKKYHVEPVQFKEIESNRYRDPSFQTTPEQAQAIFQQMWNLGYRPSDGTGNSGHVGALSKHLDDMRAIVSSKLKVELK